MKGLSLFASAGIGETYLSEIGLDLLKKPWITNHPRKLPR